MASGRSRAAAPGAHASQSRSPADRRPLRAAPPPRRSRALRKGHSESCGRSLPHSIIGSEPILHPELIFGRGAPLELRRTVLSRVVREQSRKRLSKQAALGFPLRLKKHARGGRCSDEIVIGISLRI